MKKLFILSFIVALGLGFALADVTGVCAQEEEVEEFTLEEVTVTAQKREENLQKVKGIENVSWTATPNTGGAAATNASAGARGSRGRGFTFTMTFHYKNFTKKLRN